MNTYQFPLVKSTYPVQDAKEVLLSLIQDKIKSLHLKMFSIEERFGSDTSHLEKRVEELKRESKHLIEMLNSFKDENTLIEIDCQVHFKVKQAEMSHQ